MPPITPNKPVGTLSKSLSMIVVMCPNCRKKRWANLSNKNYRHATTTCCGKDIQY